VAQSAGNRGHPVEGGVRGDSPDRPCRSGARMAHWRHSSIRVQARQQLELPPLRTCNVSACAPNTETRNVAKILLVSIRFRFMPPTTGTTMAGAVSSWLSIAKAMTHWLNFSGFLLITSTVFADSMILALFMRIAGERLPC
jgi:hypothetical protein